MTTYIDLVDDQKYLAPLLVADPSLVEGEPNSFLNVTQSLINEIAEANPNFDINKLTEGVVDILGLVDSLCPDMEIGEEEPLYSVKRNGFGGVDEGRAYKPCICAVMGEDGNKKIALTVGKLVLPVEITFNPNTEKYVVNGSYKLKITPSDVSLEKLSFVVAQASLEVGEEVYSLHVNLGFDECLGLNSLKLTHEVESGNLIDYLYCRKNGGSTEIKKLASLEVGKYPIEDLHEISTKHGLSNVITLLVDGKPQKFWGNTFINNQVRSAELNLREGISVSKYLSTKVLNILNVVQRGNKLVAQCKLTNKQPQHSTPKPVTPDALNTPF